LIFIRTDSVLSGSIVGVSGVISEIVATLFLVVYNKTIEQINFFYKSLNEKERFLTIIEMAKDLENNREETIVKIIENTLVSYNDEEKLKKE
jgi:prolyl-tRNA synthetase